MWMENAIVYEVGGQAKLVCSQVLFVSSLVESFIIYEILEVRVMRVATSHNDVLFYVT